MRAPTSSSQPALEEPITRPATTTSELERLAAALEQTRQEYAVAEGACVGCGERVERAERARQEAERAVRTAIAADLPLAEIRPLRQLADDAALELGRGEAALLRATGERERAETAVTEAREVLERARQRAHWLPERARELRRELTRLQRTADQHTHQLGQARALVAQTEAKFAQTVEAYRDLTGRELPAGPA